MTKSFLKANFDGAFCDGDSFLAGVGGIIRDVMGVVVYPFSGSVKAWNACVAECIVFRNALFLTLTLGAKNLILEGDSLEVISLLKDLNAILLWD